MTKASLIALTALVAMGATLVGCSNTSGPTKDEEVKMYQDAQKKYQNMGVGNAPATGNNPVGSRPGLSGEMAARQQTATTTSTAPTDPTAPTAPANTTGN